MVFRNSYTITFTFTFVAERDVEASSSRAAAAVERDQEVDEVDSRATWGEQSTQGGADCVTQT